MGKEYVAGVSFVEGVAHVAVLMLRKGEVSVAHVEEFKDGRNGGVWYLHSLLEKSSKIFKKVSKVSIALDNASVALHTFPIDSSLTPADRQNQIDWELGNFIPNYLSRSSINDVHVLRTRAQEHVAELLVITAGKPTVVRLQQSLAHEGFELHMLDTNHFSGQYALSINYPEARTKSVLLASIGHDRVDAGMVNHGRLSSYSFTSVASADDVASYLLKQTEASPGIDVIVYGTGIDTPMLNMLDEKFPGKLVRLNPFRMLPTASYFRDEGMLVGLEHRYTAAVGIALRRQ